MGLKSKKNKKGPIDQCTTEVDTSDPGNDQQKEDTSTAIDVSYETVTKAIKRSFDNDDQDEECSKKIKKKKKKQAVQPDSTEKKGKKSIRQMKKEKFAQRQAEAEAAAKDQHKSECMNYLSQWKHDRQNWKFMSSKQIWLYKNKFNVNLVPDASWPIFLEYFESAKGNIRNMLSKDANKVIKQMDEWTETQGQAGNNENENDTSNVEKPDDTVYNRARSLIQCLGE